MEGLAVAIALVVYSSVLNRWPPFNGVWYVPINLVATGVLVGTGIALGLDRAAFGGTEGVAADVLVGAALGAAVVVPAFLLLLSRRSARLVADERVAGLSGAAAVYQVLIRVPLGTALLEEAAFRGVLLGLFLHQGEWRAALLSSIAFGFWHVSPALNLIDANRPTAARWGRWGIVAATIAVTAAGGMFLAWLRFEFGSLGAPFGFHAALNSLATVLGIAAARRVAGSPP